MFSFLFSRRFSGISEKSSLIELAPTFLSIAATIFSSRLGRNGCNCATNRPKGMQTVKIRILVRLTRIPPLRRQIPVAILLVTLFAGLASPVQSQANGQAMVTIGHHYTITFYGYGILNDTITFSNPGTSTVQISSIQLGIPEGIVSRAAGLRFVSSAPYTTTKAENNGTTLFTITPGQPTLAPHATSTVSLESYVKDVLNTTTTSRGVQTGKLMLMTAPSINQHVDVLNLAVQLPLGVALKTAPAGFTATTNNSGTYYQKPIFNATSQSSSAQYLDYSMADTTHFQPVEFFSATRSLTASASGSPQISDSLVLKNLGSIPLSTLKLSLISKNVSTATVVASGSPPLVNPRGISIIQGVVDFNRAPFPGGIAPGDNYSFTLIYDVPSDAVKVSGGAVTVPISHSPPVDGVVGTYTIQTSFPDGITSTNSSTIKLHDATPLDRGTKTFRYSLSLGW